MTLFIIYAFLFGLVFMSYCVGRGDAEDNTADKLTIQTLQNNIRVRDDLVQELRAQVQNLMNQMAWIENEQDRNRLRSRARELIDSHDHVIGTSRSTPMTVMSQPRPPGFNLNSFFDDNRMARSLRPEPPISNKAVEELKKEEIVLDSMVRFKHL